MADHDSIRQRIIASVFVRHGTNGTPEDSYVSHIKIREDDGSGMKARYILLSLTSTGTGVIHKSKLNTNGSFSVGKTWQLPELRALEVVSPQAFNITLARTYKWQTENANDQVNFLAALIRLFRQVTGGAKAVQLIGMDDPDAAPRDSPGPRLQQPVGPPSRSESPAHVVAATRTIASTPNRARAPSPSNGHTPRQGRDRRPSASSSHLPPLNFSRESAEQAYDAYDAYDAIVEPVPAAQDFTPRSAARPHLNTTSSNFSGVSPQSSSQDLGPRPAPRPHLDATSSGLSGLSAQSSYNPLPTSLKAPSSTNGRQPSPAPSTRSAKHSARGNTPTPSDTQLTRRDHNVRVSFFDPSNQAALDRLIAGEPGAENAGEGEEESAQATMTSVEEMLEGYEWASDNVIGQKTPRSAADLIEARLLDELMALDKANIHSFLESDDRIHVVVKYLDEAIEQLDSMDSLVSSYKIHLNAVGDDISYIQSQNRGLQVQTQNQQALLKELQNLLQTVHVDREALTTLSQDSLEKASGIQRLEEAATELYKALQAGRDTEMAATMERLDEYRTHNSQFCKRIYDFLSIMVTAQSKMILDENSGIKKSGKGRPSIAHHRGLEQYLGRYAGLMLYLKEMDENVYAKLCAAYFSAISELHMRQMKALFDAYVNLVKTGSDDDVVEQNFGSAPPTSTYKAAGSIRRVGTVIRAPMEGRRDRGKDKIPDGEIRASEAFGLVLSHIAPQIYREDEFLVDFLQINDSGLTYADYAGLDNYFRRQASRSAGLSQSTMKLIRSAMDLIFGFLAGELKSWLDVALAKDTSQIVGIIATLERFLVDADEAGNAFLLHVLEKQRMRLKGLFDRHINEQIKAVEQTKLTSKKRKGVAHFIKHFPIYIGKVESQLVGVENLEIRTSVDAAYEKIVQSMFDSLKQMAKMDGEGEDKGQLNYHVIIIENMHYFVAEVTQVDVGSVAAFMKRAEAIYEENLNSYIRIVLKRPFAKIIDYFDGVERLLKTTAPTEISSNNSYNKHALKKVVREFSAKDVRKHVDALFKRVEKHFTEASEKTTTEESGGIAPGTVMVGVWKACEEELLRDTDGFTKRIAQCYADSGVALEYSAADVESAFRRHRIGS
ncbi:hypothetical protein FIBSPDRAFT_724739 [Athelia psychrophila]|uniref:Exocyst complex component Sec3 PIP2-binding N-terminal domain-containing protein n=1 Tax=Athelia psychrophila TaxID=1759441 RepID=A0A166TZX6_9AGAM|nr:hypothetical protein FIBSPDRAFT_724739 [Fibularhizoctonia sp. CBS 109695]